MWFRGSQGTVSYLMFGLIPDRCVGSAGTIARRKERKEVCGSCGQPATGYDTLNLTHKEQRGEEEMCNQQQKNHYHLFDNKNGQEAFNGFLENRRQLLPIVKAERMDEGGSRSNGKGKGGISAAARFPSTPVHVGVVAAAVLYPSEYAGRICEERKNRKYYADEQNPSQRALQANKKSIKGELGTQKLK